MSANPDGTVEAAGMLYAVTCTCGSSAVASPLCPMHGPKQPTTLTTYCSECERLRAENAADTRDTQITILSCQLANAKLGVADLRAELERVRQDNRHLRTEKALVWVQINGAEVGQ